MGHVAQPFEHVTRLAAEPSASPRTSAAYRLAA